MSPSVLAATKQKNRSNACCCKWRKECQNLKKRFGEADDPSGRGLRAFAIGWNTSVLSTQPCKAAFADCLGISVAKCNEIAKSNKEGRIHVNRLHYDPRQLARFASNMQARLTPLPWCEMKTFTDVFEKRGSISKKTYLTGFGVECPHFFHYPNYPFALAISEVQGHAIPKAASSKKRHLPLKKSLLEDLLQGVRDLDKKEQDLITEHERAVQGIRVEKEKAIKRLREETKRQDEEQIARTQSKRRVNTDHC